LNAILLGSDRGGRVQGRELDRRHIPWPIVGAELRQQALRVDIAMRGYHRQNQPPDQIHADQPQQHCHQHAQEQQASIALLPSGMLVCDQLSHAR
jgi:hypothetical protein